jgi:hypothetical protein
MRFLSIDSFLEKFLMEINVLDVVLLNTHEEATVIEKFNEENFLVEICKNDKCVLKDVKVEDIEKIVWDNKLKTVSKTH